MAIHGNPPALIKLSEIMAEFGDPGNRPVHLNQYYRGGGRVPNNPDNNAISTAGGINLAMFYGARNCPAAGISQGTFVSNGAIYERFTNGTCGYYDVLIKAAAGSIIITSSQNFVVPVGYSVIHAKILAGGGGGQGGWGNYSNAGGAGAGGLAGGKWEGDISVTSGETLYIEPGAGGQGGYGTYGGGYASSNIGPIYDNTGPNGYGGQNGGNSRIHRYSNNTDLVVIGGGLGGLKAPGNGNYANAQGYNPTSPTTTPMYDEFGTYIGDYVDPGSWHTGFSGIGAGVFNGTTYYGGAGASNYNVGGTGGYGSGGGGGAASNYDPNDYFTKGGDGGQGIIVLSWS